MAGKIKDITGEIFGFLTTLRFVERQGRHTYWLCKCACGNEIVKSLVTLRAGKTKSCGCKRSGPTSSKWRGIGELSYSYFYRVKQSAQKRKKIFRIDIEYAWNLFLRQERRCAISGLPIEFPHRVADNKTNAPSLDRIDSSQGYVEGNVQWVHKHINLMKNDLSQKYFIDMCRHVAANSVFL
jgi:hypothetical protein